MWYQYTMITGRTDTATAIAWLRAQGSETFRKGLARFGLPADKAFGLPVGTIQKYGKTLGTDHDLAKALWKSGWTDARMLAAFVGDPDRVTPAEMDAWCRDFDSWGIVDTVCFKLWDRSPHAWKKAQQWASRKPELLPSFPDGVARMARIAQRASHAHR